MFGWQAKGAAFVLGALLLVSEAEGEKLSLATKMPLPEVQTPPDIGRLSVDPLQTFLAENQVMSGVPSIGSGLYLNSFLGADRFYSAGVTGQGTKVSNIEAGHIWNAHVTLPHVTSLTTGTGALGETDRHATAVGMVLGGRNYAPAPGDYQTGIAIDTDLRSGAIATHWNPNATGNPRYTTSFGFNSTSLFTAYQPAFGDVDAINSSYGAVNPEGSNVWTIGLDGLARANPQTTLVLAVGNAGAGGANTVLWPASGYNSIAVANLANANSYDTVNVNSSRGPQNYSDPVRGVVPAARAAVDIAAPGTLITSAYYGGETGGNSPSLGGTPGGLAGTSGSFLNFSGTSYAAPIVTGAVALLDSASYHTPALAANANSRDARVLKSVLLNAATKTPGWNNGQALLGGVITTQQALDYTVGAGRVNCGAAYDQYLAGTTDLPGGGGGPVEEVGWDFGAVAPSGVNDYVIEPVLGGGTTMNVTLSSFRDRAFTDAATVSDNAYRDLDLEVWDATFTTLIAQSMSRYENVEHLAFPLPATGQYGLRVRYFQTMFGTAADENYGLAWAAVVPDPAALWMMAIPVLLLSRRPRRRNGAASGTHRLAHSASAVAVVVCLGTGASMRAEV